MADGKCFKCGSFCRYYTKGVKQFNKTKAGWCCKKCGTVYAQDGCDMFENKPKKKKISNLVKVALNNLLTEISEIRKIIEAEKSETDEEM